MLLEEKGVIKKTPPGKMVDECCPPGSVCDQDSPGIIMSIFIILLLSNQRKYGGNLTSGLCYKIQLPISIPITLYASPILICLQHKRLGPILTISKIEVNYLEVLGLVVIVLVADLSFLGMQHMLLCNLGYQQLDTLLFIGLVILDTPIFMSGVLLLGIFAGILRTLQKMISQEKISPQ